MMRLFGSRVRRLERAASQKRTAHRPRPESSDWAKRCFKTFADTAQSRLYAETKTTHINAEQLAFIRTILDRRVKAFLTSVEGELRTRSTTSIAGDTKRMGVGVFSWEEE